MILLNFLFMILFVLAFVYLVMGMIAYSHTLKNTKSDKMLAISPWWAMYNSIYDDFGRKLSKYGKVILFIEVAGFIMWTISKGV